MNETLQILEKINSLYTNTMIFFGILVAFVGVIIPIFISWYQSRQLKIEKVNLKTELFNELISDIKEYLEKEEEKFEEKTKVIEQNFEIRANAIDGGTYHVQGNNHLEEKDFLSALESFLDAATSYIEGEDERNLQTAIRIITDNCFPEINKKDLEAKPEIKTKKEELTEKLKEINEKSRYTDTIAEINRAYDIAEKRKPKKNNSNK